MTAVPKEHLDSLDGLRKVLNAQTKILTVWLYRCKAHQTGDPIFSRGDQDVLKIISGLAHMAGISAHTIIGLTRNLDLQTRDCFPIARSIVELTINAVFIMAKGKPAAERAYRHFEQKAYRDLERSSEIAGWTFRSRWMGKIGEKDEQRLSELAEEFTGRKGREITFWTDESLVERINIASERFPPKYMLSLNTAFLNIYRYSSEIIHGTYYSVMYFWGLNKPGRDPQKDEKYLDGVMFEHQFGIVVSSVFCFDALLGCIADYIGDEKMKEDALRVFKSIYELPMIIELLEDASDSTEDHT